MARWKDYSVLSTAQGFVQLKEILFSRNLETSMFQDRSMKKLYEIHSIISNFNSKFSNERQESADE